MIIVHVHVHIKSDNVDAFKEATIENARNSIKEPGILRFDVLQQEDDPTQFLLIEVYEDNNAIAQHKESAHYARWRDVVQSMMSEPRKSIKYINIFPVDKC
jgi:quinol monooxygenase YgiN